MDKSERKSAFEARDKYRTQDQLLGTSGQRIIILPHEALQQDTVVSEANFGNGIKAEIMSCDGIVTAILKCNGQNIVAEDQPNELLGVHDFEHDGCHFIVTVVDESKLDDAAKAKYFKVALATFVQGCQQVIDNANLCFLSYAEVRNRNAKYIAIDRNEYVLKEGDLNKWWEPGSGSVHSFVASANSSTKGLGEVKFGDVLKPATYKAPAKHARGNVFDPNNGLGTIEWTGPGYLR